MRAAAKEQKKQLQRRIFGEHFNYSKVGLNKEKKYLMQEQRNTEIERSNRILLEKIQRISKRSVPNPPRNRANTQVHDPEHPDSVASLFRPTRQLNYAPPGLRSQQQISKLQFSEQPTPRNDQRCLFKCVSEIGGKYFAMRAYIEGDLYVLTAEHGHTRQKIKVSLQNYRLLFREQLKGDHSRILELVRHNGIMLELVGSRRREVSIEEKE